ncbi:MAG TPA: histidine phosphatase family protein [Blastocatellia bacterium]|nr:histidine phosphatase family protein [Blastocatellia bacterium]
MPVKTVMLLRHAKSDWDDQSLRDFDRPLADRGRGDAPRIGKAIRKKGRIPDLIISSPAARARETIEAVVKSAGLEASPQFDETIYGAEPADLLKLIRSLPDSRSSVLLVGHNPTFEHLLARLAATDEHMPTAALACIEFQIDHWEDVDDGQGKLVWFVTPKDLPR